LLDADSIAMVAGRRRIMLFIDGGGEPNTQTEHYVHRITQKFHLCDADELRATALKMLDLLFSKVYITIRIRS